MQRLILVVVASSMLFCIACGGRVASVSLIPKVDPRSPQVLQGGGLPLNFTRFSPGTYSSRYGGIINGPVNMWFLDSGGPGLVKTTMTGATTEYPLPSQFPYELHPIAIASGPAGKFYILACSQGQFGALEVMDTSGKGSAYQLPVSDIGGSDCNSQQMVSGPDGNAWFAGAKDIDRITPSGVITQFPYPGGLTISQASITKGPGGLLWFVGQGGGSVDSINPSTGIITQYSFGGSGLAITAPADGNLWFVCISCAQNTITRMTPSGVFTSYSTPIVANNIRASGVGPGGWPYFLISGPPYQPQLLVVNTSTGSMNSITSPYGTDNLMAMSSGPDRNIWLTTSEGHVQIYILRVLTVTPSVLNFNAVGGTQTLTPSESGATAFTASSSNFGIATVAKGTTYNKFTVTAKGIGNCTISIQDTIGNSFNIPVEVQ